MRGSDAAQSLAPDLHHEDAGIDETWIREQRGSAVIAEGTVQWREFIEEAVRQSDLLFCRVVRSGAEIVGVLCGRRNEVVTLGPMYLLNEAKAMGGRRSDALWVTDDNERAIRFYERHGFKLTGERELWRGKLPNVGMTRDPVPCHEIA